MSKPRNSRGLARFRKREITRAFEGVPGATSVEIFPADGRIIVHKRPSSETPPQANPWDKVLTNAEKRPS
jgi:hypothetical protein